MAMREENGVGFPRRGSGGPGGASRRPWLAVWQVLLERALEAERVPPGLRKAWRGAVDAYLGEFRRHPIRISPDELRDWLLRTGELGGREPSRDLPTVMDALAFFYAKVVPSPALTRAARHPFEALPAASADTDRRLFALLRDRLVESSGRAHAVSEDWRAA